MEDGKIFSLEGKTLIYGTSMYSIRKSRPKKRRAREVTQIRKDVGTSTDTTLSSVS